jgi:parallel beta-helix repeat protein
MGFRIYRTSDGSGVMRYEKISTSPIGGGGKSLRTATRIVAASNSLDKSSADYVCDGVHDEEEINRAISDLADVGGTVLLLEGTYNIGSAGSRILEIEFGGEQAEVEMVYGIYISSNVSLVGQGKSTVLALDSANFSGSTEFFNPVILSNNQNAEISDLAIDGRSYRDVPTCSIFLINADNSVISNCTIQRCWDGLLVFISNNCIIANNYISNCTGAGIGLYYSNNCTIYGNVCNANNAGIGMYQSNENIISHNECFNNPGSGIGMSYSSNNYIGGNVCTGNMFGVYIDVDSNSNVVCNNVVNMNGWWGIALMNSSNDNLVSGNIVVGNNKSGGIFSGIFITDSSYNIIYGNIARHMGTQRYGIESRGTGSLIIDNDLYQAGISGDFVDYGTDTIYHNNRTSEGWIP